MTVCLQVIIGREFPPIYLNLYCIRTNLELLSLHQRDRLHIRGPTNDPILLANSRRRRVATDLIP
jgi:hypothetical protein